MPDYILMFPICVVPPTLPQCFQSLAAVLIARLATSVQPPWWSVLFSFPDSDLTTARTITSGQHLRLLASIVPFDNFDGALVFFTCLDKMASFCVPDLDFHAVAEAHCCQPLATW